MLGISKTAIAKKIQNGEFDTHDASYSLKNGLYTGWNFASLGFVERHAEQINLNEAGKISDKQFYWSTGLDADGTIGAMYIGARVGTLAESRYETGLRAMAAESMRFVAVDTFAQFLIYKVTDGATGNNNSYAFIESVSMDMLIGSGMYLAGRLHLGAKVLWKTPTVNNTLDYKIVMPTLQLDIYPKLLYTKADSIGAGLALGNGGQYTSAINGNKIDIPTFGSMNLKEAKE